MPGFCKIYGPRIPNIRNDSFHSLLKNYSPSAIEFMKKQNKAYIFALIAVLLWSTVASAFKITLSYLNFLQLLFFSALISTATLFSLLVLQKKLYLFQTFSAKDYAHSMMLGFMNPYLYYMALFGAYSLLPAQEAQAINYFWPIMITFFSIPLLRQKLRVQDLIAIATSFIGVLIISTRGNIFGLTFSNERGVLLALATTIIWALFWLFNLRDPRDDLAKLFLDFAFGLVFIVPTAFIFSEIKIPHSTALIGVIYIGLFEMSVTFFVWLQALKFSNKTSQVSNLIYLTPFISLVIIHFIVGEEILISTFLGLIFILAGIGIQQFKISK